MKTRLRSSTSLDFGDAGRPGFAGAVVETYGRARASRPKWSTRMVCCSPWVTWFGARTAVSTVACVHQDGGSATCAEFQAVGKCPVLPDGAGF